MERKVVSGIMLTLLLVNMVMLAFNIQPVEAEDNLENLGSLTLQYSIRNWAVIELLPSSEKNKAGRTMPVKFALRVAAEVE
ncbi:MAG: hypothetical protein NWE78_06125, partial [Candidatus Bathyarchaeota archaeon]|nr:hypothetical protein [Candidatus Bathyarchaeota archaeon]